MDPDGLQHAAKDASIASISSHRRLKIRTYFDPSVCRGRGFAQCYEPHGNSPVFETLTATRGFSAAKCNFVEPFDRPPLAARAVYPCKLCWRSGRQMVTCTRFRPYVIVCKYTDVPHLIIFTAAPCSRGQYNIYAVIRALGDAGRKSLRQIQRKLVIDIPVMPRVRRWNLSVNEVRFVNEHSHRKCRGHHKLHKLCRDFHDPSRRWTDPIPSSTPIRQWASCVL